MSGQGFKFTKKAASDATKNRLLKLQTATDQTTCCCHLAQLDPTFTKATLADGSIVKVQPLGNPNLINVVCQVHSTGFMAQHDFINPTFIGGQEIDYFLYNDTTLPTISSYIKQTNSSQTFLIQNVGYPGVVISPDGKHLLLYSFISGSISNGYKYTINWQILPNYNFDVQNSLITSSNPIIGTKTFDPALVPLAAGQAFAKYTGLFADYFDFQTGTDTSGNFVYFINHITGYETQDALFQFTNLALVYHSIQIENDGTSSYFGKFINLSDVYTFAGQSGFYNLNSSEPFSTTTQFTYKTYTVINILAGGTYYSVYSNFVTGQTPIYNNAELSGATNEISFVNSNYQGVDSRYTGYVACTDLSAYKTTDLSPTIPWGSFNNIYSGVFIRNNQKLLINAQDPNMAIQNVNQKVWQANKYTLQISPTLTSPTQIKTTNGFVPILPSSIAPRPLVSVYFTR